MEPNYTHVILLDFEATCDDKSRLQPQEIIEFPSVMVSLESQEIVDEFQAFVKPFHHPVLTEFCRNFTAISQSDVDKAARFPDVFARHTGWIDAHDLNEDNALIATCGDWDLGSMLPAQCAVAVPPVEMLSPIYTRWQNIKHTYCEVLDKPKAPGMAGMLKASGLNLVGHHHRGIDDCRNIASLYRELAGKGGKPKVTGWLPPSKYPPVTIRLCLGDRVEETRLDTRSVRRVQGLAGRLFRCRPLEILRHDGSAIWQDEDLLSICPGEELRLIPG